MVLGDTGTKVMIYPDSIPYLRQMAEARELTRISEFVLDLPDFAVWSGSSKAGQHHYGRGGLQYHTHEVVSLCVGLSGRLGLEQPLDDTVLFLSSLFHDVGKMWDYRPDTMTACMLKQSPYETWLSTPHKRDIHHISRSAIHWAKSAAQCGLDDQLTDKVLHCILSHHGTREWGSPVAPHSREAHVLHHMDAISARLNDASTNDYVAAGN